MQPNLLSKLSFLGFFLISHTFTVKAESSDISAELGFETRYFFEQGLQNQERFQPSIRGEVEYQNNIEANYFNLTLFGRFDNEDVERSHIDIREAYWAHVADDWEMKVGVSKVFWGVTESRHLVDVINQTDLVENIDGEGESRLYA